MNTMTALHMMWQLLLDRLSAWALPPDAIAGAFAHSTGVVQVTW